MATEAEILAAALVIRQWLPTLLAATARLLALAALEAAEKVRKREAGDR